FPEALAYFGLELRARGHALGPVDAWRETADEVWAAEERHRRARSGHAPDPFQPGPGEPPRIDADGEPLPDGLRAPEARGGRRRRRGGRGRGAGPAAEGAASEARAEVPAPPLPAAPLPAAAPSPRAPARREGGLRAG